MKLFFAVAAQAPNSRLGSYSLVILGIGIDINIFHCFSSVVGFEYVLYKLYIHYAH